MEEVKFSEDELLSDQDEASILSYMQKIYPGHLSSIIWSFHYCATAALISFCCWDLYFPSINNGHVLIILDEWKNFLERLGTKVTHEEIRYWASFRGQTLSRTGNLQKDYISCKLIILAHGSKLSDPFYYEMSSPRNDVLQKSTETTSFLRQDKWPRCV